MKLSVLAVSQTLKLLLAPSKGGRKLLHETYPERIGCI